MFQFEDELFRLKHKVLTRVVILAKQNNLTKEAIRNILFLENERKREHIKHNLK